MNTATEHAFESHVEEILLRQSGWRRIPNAGWDAERALFPARICRRACGSPGAALTPPANRSM